MRRCRSSIDRSARRADDLAAGVLAAAALVALRDVLPLLRDDHLRAKRFAAAIAQIDGVSVDPVRARARARAGARVRVRRGVLGSTREYSGVLGSTGGRGYACWYPRDRSRLRPGARAGAHGRGRRRRRLISA